MVRPTDVDLHQPILTHLDELSLFVRDAVENSHQIVRALQRAAEAAQRAAEANQQTIDRLQAAFRAVVAAQTDQANLRDELADLRRVVDRIEAKLEARTDDTE